MTPATLHFLGIFLAVDFAALLFFLLFWFQARARRRRIRHYGDKAEETVAEYIREAFPKSVLFNDIYLQTPHGVTQIDHLLICQWGVFVIETKSHNGKIIIHEKEWVQLYGEKVVRFHSPLLQNETHVKAVKSVLSGDRALSKVPVQGVVVFTSKKVYFSQFEKGVIRLDRLNSYIKTGQGAQKRSGDYTVSPKKHYLSRQKISQIEKRIRKYSNRAGKRRREHEKAMQSLSRTV